MRLIIISGRSGSGKSTALKALEDLGFHCIDNIPVQLLPTLLDSRPLYGKPGQQDLAVGIDVRSASIERFSRIWPDISSRPDLDWEILYLNAASPTLVQRFSETRRRHPLTAPDVDLRQAIDAERELLDDIADLADLIIDTTKLRTAELVGIVGERIAAKHPEGVNLLFRSFGFKSGIPVDAHLVFDLRCLPNPHWVAELRPCNGLSPQVAEYLGAEDAVGRMFQDIVGFLEAWLPEFEANHQAYMTVGLGCTGGQHRSVYMAQRLGAHFRARSAHVLVRHRELKATGDAAP